MSNYRLEPHPVSLPGGVELGLARCLLSPSGAPNPGPSVLLLHGASASHETFRAPDGPPGRSLVEYLLACRERWDVWLGDWRGSNKIPYLPGLGIDAWSMDRVAAVDHPALISRVLAGNGGRRLSVLAHCLGAGTLSQCIARGAFASFEDQIGAVVLTTLGLFFHVSYFAQILAEGGPLERLRDVVEVMHPDPRKCLPPSDEWHFELEEVYEQWQTSPLRPDCDLAPKDREFCLRLCFMYGAPFLHRRMHGGAAGEIHQKDLRRHFGHIPMGMYVQAAQCVFRHFSAPLDAGWSDTSDLAHPERFSRPLTLLTGAENALWHRRSIDRMHAWLENAGKKDVYRAVLPGYGHQDLFWADAAPKEVFPLLAEGLAR